jgi:hypothetical protein
MHQQAPHLQKARGTHGAGRAAAAGLEAGACQVGAVQRGAAGVGIDVEGGAALDALQRRHCHDIKAVNEIATAPDSKSSSTCDLAIVRML